MTVDLVLFPVPNMPLDSHQIVLQSLGRILLTVDLARFRAEPAEPLRKQWVIVRQQNVLRHFVSWKAQVSGLHPALEESHALLRVSRGVLGHEAKTHVLEVIVFEVEVESLAGRWDALFTAARCCTFGSFRHDCRN